MVSIFNEHGIRGTFNLNSGCFGQKDSFLQNGRTVIHNHVSKDEVAVLYKGHEVAIHTLSHPDLSKLSKKMLVYQIIEDKKNLEEIVGYPVRGMAYPYGTYNDDVLRTLKELKIEYSRVTSTHNTFNLPENYLKWSGTSHHDGGILKLGRDFIEAGGSNELLLFYVWGHSYEFDINDNWDLIENFCSMMGNNPGIWYATNIEVVDYLNALNGLKFSCTGSSVYNPSGIDVWLSVNNTATKISAGGTVKF